MEGNVSDFVHSKPMAQQSKITDPLICAKGKRRQETKLLVLENVFMKLRTKQK